MRCAAKKASTAAWLVKSGDAVRKGQPLFSYETDKVTSEGTAEVDGKLQYVALADFLGAEELERINKSLARLERYWTDQILYRL